MFAVVCAIVSLSLGIFAGDPSGISVRFDVDESSAIEGRVGWSFFEPRLHLRASYSVRQRFKVRLEDDRKFGLIFYWGGGGVANLPENFGVGILAGTSFPLGKIFEVFFELFPALYLFPATDFDIFPALGITVNLSAVNFQR